MSQLVRRVRERLPIPQRARPELPHWLADRPNALFAAGRVGTPSERRTSTRPAQPAQPSRSTRPGRPGVVDAANAPTAEELPRRQPTPAPARPRQATPRRRIVLALRSPAAVRQAIVVSEVLAPPVALRERAPGQE